jgi:hypothetical protein
MPKKSEWADARNNRSAGQTDVDGVHISGNPRPTRLDTSIDIAGRRRRPIARDFGLKFAQGHGPRRGPGKKNNVGRRLKTVEFESGPEADEGERLDESSGGHSGSEGHSCDSYAAIEAGKRARKDGAKARKKTRKNSEG